MARTDDGTIYTNSELKLLNKKKVKTPLQVHLVKSLFKGTIDKLE